VWRANRSAKIKPDVTKAYVKAVIVGDERRRKR
jgi:hypothetical protein